MSFRIPFNGAGIAFIKKNENSFSIFMGKRSRHPFICTWSVPGGSVEVKFNETPLEGAKRELLEETAIDLEKTDCRLIGSWTKRFWIFFTWTTFFYLTEESLEDSVPNEFYYLKWIDYKELSHILKRPFTTQEMRKAFKILKSLQD